MGEEESGMSSDFHPAEMSDEQLAERCKRNRLENWLQESFPWIGLLVGLAGSVTTGWLTFSREINLGCCFGAYLCLVSFPLGIGLVYALFTFLSEFRCRHLLHELRRRYGCLPLEWYAREELSQTPPGQVVVLFSGCTLPASFSWWVRLVLQQDGRSGTVETRYGAGTFDFGEGRLPDTACARAEATLDEKQASRILALAKKAEEAGSIKLSSTVKDGFPASCAVVVGGARKAILVKCNLAGIPAKKQDKPQVRLIEEVFAVGRALIDAPSLYGSCDMYGNIDIRDV
jgi:hypothetical protein